MPGKMTYDPAYAVHLSEVACAMFFGHACESTQPFTARKAELVNQWVSHFISLCLGHDHVIAKIEL
jgi:hypothetical protein